MPELKDTKARIIELRTELNQHNYAYHILNNPSISDAEYDHLFQELLTLEKLHPEMEDINSPTSRVGHASPNSFKKVRHRSRMLSLDNVFDAKEIIDKIGKGTEVTVEPKIDGLSLELVYEDGKLIRAATRGDGTSGDDVTANARTIYTIPLVLESPISIRVRGEVYLSITTFNKLNDELLAAGEEQFANPRNAAGGTLKLKDPAEVAARRLSFVAYAIPDEVEGIKTQENLTEYLWQLGFQTIPNLPCIQSIELPPLVHVLKDVPTVTQLIEDMDHYRKTLDLMTDGLVLKINDLAKQRDLGEGTRAPKWAFAFKYPPERKATKLTSIAVTIGKTGKLTPVAELQPLALSGTIVSAASLCNQDEIDRLGVNIGDEVMVEKSAEIIPKVMSVHKKHKQGTWKMPKTCPCCSTPVTKPEGFVDYYCPNKNCDEQVYNRLRHALGKAALDIDGCGDVTVKEFMKHDIRTLSDFFGAADFKFLKPAARKKLVENRDVAKHAPLWRKLHALGFDDIGKSTCQELASRWSALYALVAEENIEAVREFLGPVKFKSLVDGLSAYADEIDKLDALGVTFETDAKTTGPLTGKFFVITGSLITGKRDDVALRIEQAGGVVKSAMSKNIHYLVQGDEGGRNKADAARKFGTTVISEEQLYALMGIPMPTPRSLVAADHEF
jgi:DNA ligase (NAD+)